MAKTIGNYFDELRGTRVWRSVFRGGTLEAPSARATAAAVIVDQLRIRHHLVKRRTQNPTATFATHRPWVVPHRVQIHKLLLGIVLRHAYPGAIGAWEAPNRGRGWAAALRLLLESPHTPGGKGRPKRGTRKEIH